MYKIPTQSASHPARQDTLECALALANGYLINLNFPSFSWRAFRVK